MQLQCIKLQFGVDREKSRANIQQRLKKYNPATHINPPVKIHFCLSMVAASCYLKPFVLVYDLQVRFSVPILSSKLISVEILTFVKNLPLHVKLTVNLIEKKTHTKRRTQRST